jgi:hypothetical protein
MSAENYVEAVKRYQGAVAGQMHEVERVLSNCSSFCFRRFTGCRFASLIVCRNEMGSLICRLYQPQFHDFAILVSFLSFDQAFAAVDVTHAPAPFTQAENENATALLPRQLPHDKKNLHHTQKRDKEPINKPERTSNSSRIRPPACGRDAPPPRQWQGRGQARRVCER